jgi:hypothetical protein
MTLMQAALGLETALARGDSGAPSELGGDSERPSVLSPTSIDERAYVP